MNYVLMANRAQRCKVLLAGLCACGFLVAIFELPRITDTGSLSTEFPLPSAGTTATDIVTFSNTAYSVRLPPRNILEYLLYHKANHKGTTSGSWSFDGARNFNRTAEEVAWSEKVGKLSMWWGEQTDAFHKADSDHDGKKQKWRKCRAKRRLSSKTTVGVSVKTCQTVCIS